ncbi:Succinate dehydrogenase/fumarate reductase, flavoprotein subunit [Andreprevotia lacus DSM 23236]|jgi:succinate dehydrogenase/fumarate reductase flavoprotein subunit|uniref:Succinate dehydrogenase/fumarate reductase, flavoprotein subunit n=1 Tax=Andreprevotia lacus DSM 23236 TaxID=1121001 RepID=A0A1W1XFA1_9NEIS|nr:FAD-binding protein [Andreprevotia lacus]SMC22643.1 Succinate dehydrogenase/fumarate reductase, flavoprotein subunit [Andreprevotia lacus DSM 23236]
MATNAHTDLRTLHTDVLVIGGGPAGCWAAWRAARSGARVVLADKGYVGTSGATAPSGTGVWYVPPEAEAREAALASREALGGYLADRGWGTRVLDQTYANLEQVAQWGYPFPLDDQGRQRRTSLQGPEYMKLMRKVVKQAGVSILDQSPALQLLLDDEGSVVGAEGVSRQGDERWQVRAGAVVLATGGCAFLSNALGCNVLTGDGYLLAAESGAELSGMEFSNAYGLSPAFSSVTKSAFYRWATFRYEDGSLIDGAGSKHGRSIIARHLEGGTQVYALLDLATDADRQYARSAQPNFFLPFDRIGIDPFTRQFPVTLRLEGTVRGTGGLRLVDEGCATTVRGLYAAGDAATRELICGAFTGGGSHNAAWATSSGYWAGEAAAAFALQQGRQSHARSAIAAGGATQSGSQQLDSRALIQAVQQEVQPYSKNLFRSGEGLDASLARLDGYWRSVRQSTPATNAAEQLRAREATAMLATARWMYRSALARTETRGMHKRLDHAGEDPAQQHYIHSGGLDRVWTRNHRAPWHVPALQAEVAA